MCFYILRRDSRWTPKVAGKRFLGKAINRLHRYAAGQKFLRNPSISFRFRGKTRFCILR